MATHDTFFYAGEFHHNLDEKLRLTVPSKWRFDSNNLYLALPNPLGCITIYPPQMVQQLQEKISAISLGDSQGQRTLISLLSPAESFSIDGNGRILLGKKLYNHAHIQKKVVLIGTLNKFQLWEPEHYEHCLKQQSDPQNLGRLLQDLGL